MPYTYRTVCSSYFFYYWEQCAYRKPNRTRILATNHKSLCTSVLCRFRPFSKIRGTRNQTCLLRYVFDTHILQDGNILKKFMKYFYSENFLTLYECFSPLSLTTLYSFKEFSSSRSLACISCLNLSQSYKVLFWIAFSYSNPWKDEGSNTCKSLLVLGKHSVS